MVSVRSKHSLYRCQISLNTILRPDSRTVNLFWIVASLSVPFQPPIIFNKISAYSFDKLHPLAIKSAQNYSEIEPDVLMLPRWDKLLILAQRDTYHNRWEGLGTYLDTSSSMISRLMFLECMDSVCRWLEETTAIFVVNFWRNGKASTCKVGPFVSDPFYENWCTIGEKVLYIRDDDSGYR